MLEGLERKKKLRHSLLLLPRAGTRCRTQTRPRACSYCFAGCCAVLCANHGAGAGRPPQTDEEARERPAHQGAALADGLLLRLLAAIRAHQLRMCPARAAPQLAASLLIPPPSLVPPAPFRFASARPQVSTAAAWAAVQAKAGDSFICVQFSAVRGGTEEATSLASEYSLEIV